MKSNFLVFLLAINQGLLLAFNPSYPAFPENDSSYIKPFSNRPQLTFEFARRSQQIDLVNPSNKRQVVSYQPNTRINFIGTFDYRWLSLSLGFFSMGAADNAKKGETDQFSLRFSLNGKRLWNSNAFQFYRGYFLSNPSKVIPKWNPATDYFPQRPDILAFTWFSNLYYCFNPRHFSYRAALWQLDKQERSGGSFITGLSYRFNLISSDENRSMIPVVLNSDFLPQNRAIAIRQSTLTLHGGYVHSFVAPSDLFLTLYFLPGIAMESGASLPEDNILRVYDSGLTFATEFRFIAGYNGDRWFGGLSLHSIAFSGSNNEELLVNSSMSSARLFFGFRFAEVNRKKNPRVLNDIGL